MRSDLPLASISRSLRRRWRAQSTTAEPEPGANVYRCVGSITIARAGSTQREIDAMPDPLTIDLSGVEKMDTVGAWLIYRTVRDRGAKVVGASHDVAGLLDQVAEADRPVQVRPEERPGPLRILDEIGEWVVRCRQDAGRPGRLPRRGAARLRGDHPPAQALPPQCRHPAVRPGRRPRAGHHRADELPDRHRHRPAGRGAARSSSAPKSTPSTSSAGSRCASWAR